MKHVDTIQKGTEHLYTPITLWNTHITKSLIILLCIVFSWIRANSFTCNIFLMIVLNPLKLAIRKKVSWWINITTEDIFNSIHKYQFKIHYIPQSKEVRRFKDISPNTWAIGVMLTERNDYKKCYTFSLELNT